jgi:hypothetical protein
MFFCMWNQHVANFCTALKLESEEDFPGVCRNSSIDAIWDRHGEAAEVDFLKKPSLKLFHFGSFCGLSVCDQRINGPECECGFRIEVHNECRAIQFCGEKRPRWCCTKRKREKEERATYTTTRKPAAMCATRAKDRARQAGAWRHGWRKRLGGASPATICEEPEGPAPNSPPTMSDLVKLPCNKENGRALRAARSWARRRE